MEKLPNDRVSDGVEVRHHPKTYLWPYGVALFGLSLTVISSFLQDGILSAIGIGSAFIGAMTGFGYSHTPYFIYNAKRILTKPYQRSMVNPQRKMFVIKTPDDIDIKNNKVVMRYENSPLYHPGRLLLRQNAKGEPNRVIAKKSWANPDDWEKFVHWVNDLKKHHVIKH